VPTKKLIVVAEPNGASKSTYRLQSCCSEPL
jgi:hypothetical protein